MQAERGLPGFLIRVAAVTCAALLVLYAARSWLVPRPQAPPQPERPPSARPERRPPADVISWREAAKHYGEFLTVEGVVVLSHNSGKACFLNFHESWETSFTAVIFARRFAAFPPSPEDHYRGKRVRVTGLIREYRGKPEIVLDSPGQIEVVR